MGDGVSFRIVNEMPIRLGKSSVGIGEHNYTLTRSYVHKGITHFVGKSLFGDTIDFIVKGRNALICEH